MSVDKELIEKYHLGLCSEEEMQQVEEWLLQEEKEELTFPTGEDKLALKNEMWDYLATQIPSLQEQPKQPYLSDYFSSVLWRACAASFLLLMCVGILWYYSSRGQQEHPASIAQKEQVTPDPMTSNKVAIVLGQQSVANLSMKQKKSGSLDFCGTILIQPKEDVELTVNGNCTLPSVDQEKRSFKKGETYVAVNYQFNQAKELIIVEERKLINLPPLVQREIMKQFPI